ncbi:MULTISPECIES: DUF2304 domain-containing protein [Streptococcus]|uniref:DUF2304 domain-containing protein n=1 Tax=Streptococcus iners subsp. hyiners TaxID=3028083 RepID=A0AA97A2K3_9STRE|nr:MULTISPECIES: DUF2304 domain-containing protein [Streptococcus]MCK3942340.1 DUF2304 domain-containing protein [Streptococcus suis]MCK4030152.1 DUF2304 domain-containing protein [Streptococcus suis]WNY48860.1 DUF2304 domain-containing protein [Streptococcus sp. 29892]HEM4130251.1 DUF2304 domain-containing protein [Streptococcus suis]
MSLLFQTILILVSLLTGVLILRRIRKSQLQIPDALFWIFFSALLLILSLFPSLAEAITKLLGIALPVNFIFLFIIFLLIIHQFQLTMRLSKLDNKLKELAQTIAIERFDKDE